ncbi:MAG TPA: alkaline phosphatase family protein [Marmoricola sp.]|nr:alkaline phosphatase family protein [Marmoricola sp.]
MRLTVAAGAVLPLVAVASTALPTAVADPGSGSSDRDRADKPTRVVQIVLDQLRPEFIEAFDMENVQALMAGGASFENAYLGHMASETVVSHNVMTSGLLPKHMGWADEWFRDSKGLLGPRGGRYVTGSMSQEQFDTLILDKGYPKLADYLKAEFPDKVVAAIGEKAYAVNTYGGPGADYRITYTGRDYDCDGDGTDNWRGPDASAGAPSYLTQPECGRFYIESDKAHDHGTATTAPAWMYPTEGHRDVPGEDPAHLGGDVWVADAAFEVMDHEEWSGLLLTFSGIDKAGHMWGGLNDVPPYPGGDKDVHMAAQARVADEQVGRIMDRLEADGLLDETLVVLTTDHGQLRSKHFYGVNEAGRGNLNWYYGSDADEEYLDPSPEIQRLIDGTGDNIEMSMQDSAIRAWLVDRSRADKRRAARVMATLGGVQATYYRVGRRYVLHSLAPRSEWEWAEWRWHRQHAREIVNTMAAGYAADVVGLLADDTSYGVAGDHGGAQESVQRIPIVFAGAGVRPGTTPEADMRSVDIMPTILTEMGIAKTRWTDGRSKRVP